MIKDIAELFEPWDISSELQEEITTTKDYDQSKLQIDMRSPHVAYIKMGDKTVYLDNSTGEQIVEITEGED